MKDLDSKDIIILLCGIILPPLGVYFKVGLRSQFWINIVLTIFGFHILGILHALFVILKK